MIFEEWIGKAHSLGASDLHLETDTPVVARIRGDLQTVGGTIAGERLLQAGQDLLGAEGWAQFKERGSADISVAIAGPTGAGKSTTLAALIEEINASRARNIVTLESPLEYIFTNRRCFIRQREIPTHSPSFEQGIIDALRENPDVLVISEMRTPEVMRLTLNAAETGHLVLATMHAANCTEALSRVCMSFPAEIQGSIRAQLADCLVGVSCQRLDFLSAHRLRVPRCELLLPSSGAKGTIRSGNFSQLANVLQSGGDEGMWTFDRYQRWIEQVSDWARPTAAAASRQPGESKGAAFTSRGPATKPIPSTKPMAAAKPMPAANPAAASKSTTDDDVIEVPVEEMGLAELAELARKVVERKP